MVVSSPHRKLDATSFARALTAASAQAIGTLCWSPIGPMTLSCSRQDPLSCPPMHRHGHSLPPTPSAWLLPHAVTLCGGIGGLSWPAQESEWTAVTASVNHNPVAAVFDFNIVHATTHVLNIVNDAAQISRVFQWSSPNGVLGIPPRCEPRSALVPRHTRALMARPLHFRSLLPQPLAGLS